MPTPFQAGDKVKPFSSSIRRKLVSWRDGEMVSFRLSLIAYRLSRFHQLSFSYLFISTGEQVKIRTGL